MNEWEKLRFALIEYLRKKFFSHSFISDVAEDIVNEAFSTVPINSGKCNFGYLSKVCVHIAYRMFKRIECDSTKQIPFDDALDFMDDRDVVDEIIASENASEIFASLEVLKQIEYIIVVQRHNIFPLHHRCLHLVHCKIHPQVKSSQKECKMQFFLQHHEKKFLLFCHKNAHRPATTTGKCLTYRHIYCQYPDVAPCPPLLKRNICLKFLQSKGFQSSRVPLHGTNDRRCSQRLKIIGLCSAFALSNAS